MVVMNPKFWNTYNGGQLIHDLFRKNMVILGSYFGKVVEVNGLKVNGNLNKELLTK